jgi:hypothetical protein
MTAHRNHHTHATRATSAPLADLPEVERIAETRRLLASMYGQVWDAAEVAAEFEITDTLGDLTFVRRRADGVYGSLWRHGADELWSGWQAAGGGRRW